MAESNFSEKGAFVSFYQPTVPVAGGWLHQLNKWDLSGAVGVYMKWRCLVEVLFH